MTRLFFYVYIALIQTLLTHCKAPATNDVRSRGMVTTRASSDNQASALTNGSSASECRIAQAQCMKAPSLAGYFSDTSSPVYASDPNACKQRASDFHRACGNPDNVPTVATYYQNGKTAQSAVAGSYCEIRQAICPSHPTWVGTFIDDATSSSPARDNCLRRASDFHLACGNPDAVPTTATFFQDGVAVASNTIGKGFVPWRDEPFVIGAWYFGMWSTLDSYHAGLSMNTVHRFDPWGGVRDLYPGPSIPVNLQNLDVYRKPIIGYYDAMDQRVMDQHLQQAASHGLSYFAFYWYWNSQTNEEYASLDSPLHNYFSSPYKNLMKVMVAPINIGGPMSLDAFKTRLVPYLARTYLADPDYFRTADGRPIIIDWDFGLSPGDRMAGLSYLRDYMISHYGTSPMILAKTDGAVTSSDFANRLLGHDGFQCFQQDMLPHTNGEPLAKSLSRWSATFNNIAKVTGGAYFLPCTSAGFDTKPWAVIDSGYATAKNNSGINPTAFATHLSVVKTFLANHPQMQKSLTIYAWNEWGEGGVIEPGFAFGTKFIDNIRDTFGLIPRIGSPGPTSLEGTYPASGVATASHQAQVILAYRTLLKRDPTSAEIQTWSSSLESSVARGDFIKSLLNSSEFLTLHAQDLATPKRAVDLMYALMYNRNPSAYEESYWLPFATAANFAALCEWQLYHSEHRVLFPGLTENSGEPMPLAPAIR